MALVAASMASGPVVRAAVINDTWNGLVAGNWNLAANWNSGVPNNGGGNTFNVFIDGGHVQNTVVTLDLSPTVDNLSISSGDQLLFTNNTFLTLAGTSGTATVTNAGTITVLAAVNNSSLRSAGGVNTNLTGGGTIVMSGGNSQLGGVGGTMTNLNNLIRGEGQIGINNTAFDNRGTINADVPLSSIFIDPVAAAGGFLNSGNMTASNGGTLRFNGQFGGGVDNTGGTISAQNASAVSLEGSIGITGGTFTTTGTGVVNVATGNSASLGSFANSGNITVNNNATLFLSGNVTNSGSINLSAGTNNSTLTPSGTVNLSGGGSVNMTTTGAGGTAFIGGGGTLINVNNTIRGAGNLGQNNTAFANGVAGLVDANIAGQTLFCDPVATAGGFVNSGLMRASNGGILQLHGQFGGGITNAGTIQALAGSNVNLLGTIGISGGTFATVGSGSINVAQGQTAFIDAVTNTGSLVVENNSDLQISTSLVNSGSITLSASANNSRMFPTSGSTVSLSGSGTVTLLTNGTFAGSAVLGGTGTLTNVNNVIQGFGNLASNNMHFTNATAGVVNANVNGRVLFVDPISVTGPDMINDGLMTASNGGVLQFHGQFGGGITNTGVISAQNGSNVQLLGTIGISGGTISTGGTGTILVNDGHTAFLDALTLNGNVQVGNNTDLQLSGTITNLGSINLNAAANNSRMFPTSGGSVSLTGGGSVNLSTTAAGIAYLGNGGGTIDTNNTVRGFGNIAGNNTAIVSRNLISAAGGDLFVDPVAATNGFLNLGTMRAETGASLTLHGQFGGGVNNSGGTITAQTGAVVQLAGSIGVTGGSFTTSGTGSISVPGGQTAFLDNLTLNGNVNVGNNSDLQISGTITNLGSINLNAAGANSRLLPSSSGSVSLTGGGTVNLSTTAAGIAYLGQGGGTIDTNNTVRGFGNIAGNNTAIVSRNLITASGGDLFVDPVAAANGFVNLGTMRAETGASLTISGQFGGGVTSTGGAIVVQPGGTMITTTSLGLAAGSIQLDGTWNHTNSSNATATNVRGAGSLNVNTSAVLTINADGGPGGTSRVSALSIATSGRLDVKDNDLVIDYTGASPIATIRPMLASAYASGNWTGPGLASSTAGASTTLKTALGYLDNTSGSFASFGGQSVDNTSILVKYTYSGDTNLDGQVDITDLGNLATSWQVAGLWVNGDLDYSGFIDITDLGLLATNWQAGVGSPLRPSLGEALVALGLPSAAVPEPLGAATLTCAAAILGSLRRRNRRQRSVIKS
jgi:hypothetical protein